MPSRPVINVVWFKRDLRLRDHAPLRAAVASGRPVLLLYCFEPSVVADPNYDLRHWRFVAESLADLNRQLSRLTVRPGADQPVQVPTHEWLPFEFTDEPAMLTGDAPIGGPAMVWVFRREVTDVLAAVQTQYTIDTLYSHEETGLKVTYDRDKAVARFCRDQRIPWQEFQCNGVIRRLHNRDTWPADWQRTMRAPQEQPDLDRLLAVSVADDWYQAERGPDLPANWHVPDPLFQPGGEQNAFRYMDSFMTERIALYAQSISKPLESRRGCSRLSPYIAWGCLSIRQVYQAQLQAREVIGFKGQFNALASRLRWHCHFIQKFESEDRIEFENVNRAFDALEKNENAAHYAAWRDGNTGYPMVDACMRCLTATGYINFRMRAMLMSFLSHHLLQHWKEGALHMARLYTDFEPGIHYAQIQMQSGMTGTNTVRIYNPVKQSQDHDPMGIFIKQWIPELANCPVAYIHEPWTMPPLEQDMAHFRVGTDYPAPIVDIAQTGREARVKLHQPRKTATGEAEKTRILKRHVIPTTPTAAPRRKAGAARKKPTEQPGQPNNA